MGGRLCLCRMPAAQISHADSSSPWLTCCPKNTSLSTNTSFSKRSTHTLACAVHTLYKYSFRHKDAPTHKLPQSETWQKINLMPSLLCHYTNCIVVSNTASHLVNHLGQKMSSVSGCCLNHAPPKSYFHHGRSISQRSHQVRRTPTPGFVGARWWYGEVLTWLSGWCGTFFPDRQPFWGPAFLTPMCH